MMQAKSEAYDLARRMLAYESEANARVANPAHADDYGLVELAQATDRICQKLFQRLADLISFTGTTLLLERSVRLAKVDYPFLSSIKVGAEGHLDGLDAVAKERPSADVGEALVALIGLYIWLLASFIGQDMVLLLFGGVWPRLLSDEGSSVPKEEEA